MKFSLAKNIFLAFLCSLLIGVLTASAENTSASRDKAFQRRCELGQTAEQDSEACMRYFRSIHKNKYSRKECEQNPSSEVCQSKLQKSDSENYRKRDTSSGREFRAFCRKNKDAPRCRKFTKKRAPRRKSASSQIQRLSSAKN